MQKKRKYQLSIINYFLPLHSQNENGRLDERLSQRSAKPSTPVRIGYRPHQVASIKQHISKWRYAVFRMYLNIRFHTFIILYKVARVPMCAINKKRGLLPTVA